MDEAVQEAKLLRQVNALIVAHLRGQNLGQAASAVASATMTPLSAADSVPADHLLRLVARVTLCSPPFLLPSDFFFPFLNPRYWFARASRRSGEEQFPCSTPLLVTAELCPLWAPLLWISGKPPLCLCAPVSCYWSLRW
jgi:hypothetical protein